MYFTRKESHEIRYSYVSCDVRCRTFESYFGCFARRSAGNVDIELSEELNEVYVYLGHLAEISESAKVEIQISAVKEYVKNRRVSVILIDDSYSRVDIIDLDIA